VADNKLAGLSDEEAERELKKIIAQKQNNLVGNMLSQGTTPRRITDLLASLADLTSGSGDKGTPIVLVQNYFKNYSM
ncbi:MAG: coenzyme F420-0:L-glutamate ligase, partial [Clostridia bacterium]|nr:coenzyme F420-0:L-glutamate ligase [Clostridia bacterium]